MNTQQNIRDDSYPHLDNTLIQNTVNILCDMRHLRVNLEWLQDEEERAEGLGSEGPFRRDYGNRTEAQSVVWRLGQDQGPHPEMQ